MNVGSIDLALRIAIGLMLISATLGGLIGPWGWLGVVPLATGLFKRCPAYSLIGVNTCAKR